jgi:hypothetical protein
VKRPSSLRRRLIPAIAAIAVAGVIATAWLVQPRLEEAIRLRIDQEAARRGLVVRVGTVRVRPWPLLRLEGVRVEKPGSWSIAADEVAVTLRPWGHGLVGRTRLALARVTVAGPASLGLESVPAVWDIVTSGTGAVGAEVREPVTGLTATWLPAAGGGQLDVRATAFPAGRVFTLQRDSVPLLDPGTLTGAVHLTIAEATTFDLNLDGRALRLAALSNESLFSGEPVAFGVPTDVTTQLAGSWRPAEEALDVPHWRLATGGASLSGALSLADVRHDPRLDLSLEVEHLDFAQVLDSSGLDEPTSVAVLESTPSTRTRELGAASLSAHATGRLADPSSFVVSQRLDFTPPKRPLPAVERLRSDFVHEVTLATGGRRAIVVSPASPDFVPFGDVPPLFVRTLLLGEDSGFFGHSGIDLSEVPSAILTNWSRGGVARGASTITQQLAKNLFLSREKRLGRKLQELSLALLVEATLTKERILEIYLNVIEWGPDVYGLRPAAWRYFGVEPRALTPKQMAFLVALIPGPVKYQRSFADGSLSPGFRPLVDSLLAKLRSVDLLTEDEYQAARNEELQIRTATPDGAS